jgi:hypothetical protein
MTFSSYKSMWNMTLILTIAVAPFAAWKRDPMIWGLVYAFLFELTGVAVLMLTMLGSITFSHFFALRINYDPAAALAVLGLLVLILSCWEYRRTGAYGDRR